MNSPERRASLVLNLAVVAAIAAVAYADYVVLSISLGYLYVLPLALSAVIHRRRTSLALVVVCVALHDWFGPFEHAGGMHIWRNVLTAIAFATIVLVLNSMSGQRVALLEIVRSQRDALESEIKAAARVQRQLLPTAPPQIPGFEIAGVMVPSRVLSGDYYDYLQLPGGRLGVVVADVSGKGAGAALLMVSAETALRLNAAQTREVSAIIQKLNGVMTAITDGEQYVTLFLASLDPNTRRMEYTNAGHVPALLLRANEPEPRRLATGGVVAGLLADARFEGESVQLAPGDVLLLYTDGVTEAANPSNELFGTERLIRVLRQCRNFAAGRIVESILDAVRTFGAGAHQADDITLVALRATETPDNRP